MQEYINVDRDLKGTEHIGEQPTKMGRSRLKMQSGDKENWARTETKKSGKYGINLLQWSPRAFGTLDSSPWGVIPIATGAKQYQREERDIIRPWVSS